MYQNISENPPQNTKKSTPKSTKIDPRPIQVALGWPKLPEMFPETLKRASKRAQKTPRVTKEVSKRAPKAPKEIPRDPKGPQTGPQALKKVPKRGHGHTQKRQKNKKVDIAKPSIILRFYVVFLIFWRPRLAHKTTI